MVHEGGPARSAARAGMFGPDDVRKRRPFRPPRCAEDTCGLGGVDTLSVAAGSPVARTEVRLADPIVPGSTRSWATSVGLGIALPLVVVILSWHALALEPHPGLDNSWQAALHMALHDGITFGDHLVFTYGPLGFLSVPTLWYAGTGAIALVYTVLIRFALVVAVFAGARRSYGPIAGFICALLVACASEVTPETVPFVVFSVWVVNSVADDRRLAASMAVAGAVAGLELLNKESIGIEIAVLALIVALAARGRRGRNVAIMLCGLVGTLLTGWIATGQRLDALPAYVHGAARVISGYAAAMSISEASLSWEYTAACVAFLFGLAAALHMTSIATTRTRWGIVAIWVAFSFFEFKEGFVRHDSGHAAIYFVSLMGGFFAFRWRPGSQLVGLGLASALFVFTLAAEGSSISELFDPGGNASMAISQVEEVADKSERNAIIARGRTAIKEALPLDPQTLAILRGHTVHVAPYETAAAWAYRLDWRPLPVFQSYTAYTTGLDQMNADALNSRSAPERILRNLDQGIDGRVLEFDEGDTNRTILCRYRELRTTGAWQVLGLGPNRCLPPVALEVVHADWDQEVNVPAPPNNHSFVFVRIGGVAVSGLERVEAALYKPAIRMVLLDGEPHRLLSGTATDGLLLRAPGGVDFTAPFNFAPNSRTIAVSKEGSTAGDRPITFSFFSQSVSVGPRY
jgi:hypothetical protein